MNPIVIGVIVIGGLLLFCCLGAVVRLVWYLVNYSSTISRFAQILTSFEN